MPEEPSFSGQSEQEDLGLTQAISKSFFSPRVHGGRSLIGHCHVEMML